MSRRRKRTGPPLLSVGLSDDLKAVVGGVLAVTRGLRVIVPKRAVALHLGLEVIGTYAARTLGFAGLEVRAREDEPCDEGKR